MKGTLAINGDQPDTPSIWKEPIQSVEEANLIKLILLVFIWNIYLNYDIDNLSWVVCIVFTLNIRASYRIRPNYRTYPVSAQSSKSIILRLQPVYFFVYFFIMAYVVSTHLNCIDLSMQFKWVPTTYAFIKKIRKKHAQKHRISIIW